MSKVIIHISDLHVTVYKGTDGRINNSINSYLTTNSDTSDSFFFVNTFLKKVREEFYNGEELILLITGDISNEGDKSEFEYAQKFIQHIVDELSIPVNNILLLPGDHDVHRRTLENYLDDNPTEEPHLYHDIKFSNFSNLYKAIKAANFQFDKLIIDHIIIDDKIVLIGINSNYKINNWGGLGYLPIEHFGNELSELKAKLGEKDYQYIVCWHHNITSGFENLNSGQWEPDNRIYLLSELERHNIKLILTGNEHTNNSKDIQFGTLITSDSGAVSTIRDDATFKAYIVEANPDKVSLGHRCFALQKTNGNNGKYFWDVRSNKASRQPDEFVLFEANKESIKSVVELPHEKPEEGNSPTEENIINSERTFYDNIDTASKLYDMVKAKGLFHSGHFHWSDTSRAHNWIDVSKLLEDNKALYFVQNAVIEIIQSFNLQQQCDLIIGLGYEGNFLSSKASIKFDIPYTSLPYSYRYEDHHDYEKKLNFDNSKGTYKTVIVITDVVNDGRTIRRLIGKEEAIFFSNVEKVIVLSLFYTGHADIDVNILNFDMLPSDFDKQNDHEVNNIEFYSIKSLRVEKCPYGSNYKEECFIYKDELSCVHLFYAE